MAAEIPTLLGDFSSPWLKSSTGRLHWHDILGLAAVPAAQALFDPILAGCIAYYAESARPLAFALGVAFCVIAGLRHVGLQADWTLMVSCGGERNERNVACLTICHRPRSCPPALVLRRSQCVAYREE